MFLGSAILVPISEVGSVASAAGWTAACLAYRRLLVVQRDERLSRSMDYTIACVGAAVGGALVAMKIVPAVPGHFTEWEWLALGLWIVLGILIGRPLNSRVAAGEDRNIISNTGQQT